jgi:hypothetical protein
MLRRVQLLIGATAAVALLSTCAVNPSPSTGAMVEMMADYPSFDENQLAESADLIVEGTALSSRGTVLTAHYEGDTEQENPMHGLTAEEQKNAITDDVVVPATAVTFRVDVVHKGPVQAGQEIVILQTGGAFDGVTHAVREEEPLQVDSSYLIFAGEGNDGAYFILGGSAGSYIWDGNEAFVAVNPDVAPFLQIDSAEAKAMTN